MRVSSVSFSVVLHDLIVSFQSKFNKNCLNALSDWKLEINRKADQSQSAIHVKTVRKKLV